MMHYAITERLIGVTFAKTVKEVADAASEREKEIRESVEKRLKKIEKLLKKTKSETNDPEKVVHYFARHLGATWFDLRAGENLRTMLVQASLIHTERNLADQYGLIVKHLRAEERSNRRENDDRVMLLSNSDLSLFQPFDLSWHEKQVTGRMFPNYSSYTMNGLGGGSAVTAMPADRFVEQAHHHHRGLGALAGGPPLGAGGLSAEIDRFDDLAAGEDAPE